MGVLEDFKEISGIKSDVEAQSWLEMGEGNCEKALELFWDHGSGSHSGTPSMHPADEAMFGSGEEMNDPALERVLSSSMASQQSASSSSSMGSLHSGAAEGDDFLVRQADAAKRQRLLYNDGRRPRSAHLSRHTDVFAGSPAAFGAQANRKRKAPTAKEKKLQDLFQRPVDLMFHGTLIQCREEAKIKNKWVLVNIQDEHDFDCHKLNRDIWRDDGIAGYLRENFVFWQQLKDSSEGSSFRNNYKVVDSLHLNIIDPRTGLSKWRKDGAFVDSEDFRNYLFEAFTRFIEKEGTGPFKNPSSVPNVPPSMIQTQGADWSALGDTAEDDDMRRAMALSLGSSAPAPRAPPVDSLVDLTASPVGAGTGNSSSGHMHDVIKDGVGQVTVVTEAEDPSLTVPDLSESGFSVAGLMAGGTPVQEVEPATFDSELHCRVNLRIPCGTGLTKTVVALPKSTTLSELARFVAAKLVGTDGAERADKVKFDLLFDFPQKRIGVLILTAREEGAGEPTLVSAGVPGQMVSMVSV